MVAQVLATWRRILDGEQDEGGEMIEGESDVRKYLTKIKDATLVQEYGTWLARRNPKLGVQVFADDSSRVKFTPAGTVAVSVEPADAMESEAMAGAEPVPRSLGLHFACGTMDRLQIYLGEQKAPGDETQPHRRDPRRGGPSLAETRDVVWRAG